MKKYDVEITGTAALLQNKMPDLSEASEKVGESRDSPEACANKLYVLDGKVCQPAVTIERALVKAATGIKQKGARGKTFKDLFMGAVFVRPEYIQHAIQKWEVHKTTVVIKATRGRINRYRPMLPEWRLRFEVEVLDDRVSTEVLKLALDDAGRTIGIGDWRPRYGRFVVSKFKEV